MDSLVPPISVGNGGVILYLVRTKGILRSFETQRCVCNMWAILEYYIIQVIYSHRQIALHSEGNKIHTHGSGVGGRGLLGTLIRAHSAWWSPHPILQTALELLVSVVLL